MKIVEMPEFMADATNVYRTRYYIVRQKIELRDDPEFGRYLFSADTYYLCTPKRDREYESVFAGSFARNGRRICTPMYVRRYVD